MESAAVSEEKLELRWLGVRREKIRLGPGAGTKDAPPTNRGILGDVAYAHLFLFFRKHKLSRRRTSERRAHTARADTRGGSEF